MPSKRIDTGIGGLDAADERVPADETQEDVQDAKDALEVKNVDPAATAGASDTPENANEEFGRGDQEFGGGPGDVEYGDEKIAVGTEGIVAEGSVVERPFVTPDEKEGVVLPGSDDSEDVDDELDEAE